MPSYRRWGFLSQVEFSDATLRNVVRFEQTLHENLARSILDRPNIVQKLWGNSVLVQNFLKKTREKVIIAVFSVSKVPPDSRILLDSATVPVPVHFWFIWGQDAGKTPKTSQAL